MHLHRSPVNLLLEAGLFSEKSGELFVEARLCGTCQVSVDAAPIECM